VVTIAVVHLVRHCNELSALSNFISSYDAHPAGIEHDLAVIFKGFEAKDSHTLEKCRSILSGKSYREIFLDDSGFDLGSYFKAYKHFDYDFYCFLNSFSVILADNWLLKLAAAARGDGVGIVGATGSYESIYSEICLWRLKDLWIRHKPLSPYVPGGYDDGFQKNELAALRKLESQYPPFPNFHIRTNAFLLPKNVLDRIRIPDLRQKDDAYVFESGANGLTRQIMAMNLAPLVVGNNGKSYSREEWIESRTFWSTDTSNLLVEDNQTRMFRTSDAIRKKELHNSAWMGPFKRKSPARRRSWRAACPLCTREARPFVRAMDYNRRITEEQFSYFQCRFCKYVFLNPVPSDLGKYYPPDYYQIPSSIDELRINAEKYERYKIEIVKQFKKAGKLLEVGPATGGFALLAKEQGFNVDVIEMDKRCCDFLSTAVGVNVHNSTESDAVLESLDEKFDVIALWHVIEHLQDYRSVLSAAIRRLTHDGILVIAAPNPGALGLRMFRKYWAHLDAPRHVALIPIYLLTRQLQLMGMKPILITTKDTGSLHWNKFGFERSVRNYVADGSRFPLIVRGFRRILVKAVRTAEPAVTLAEWMNGWGSAYAAVYQKKALR